jgi:uncharacterized protein (DUF2062 family)
MMAFIERRVLQPVRGLLTLGMTPKRLALCVAIGIVVGNVPILGVSTLLCAGIALVFGLNLPAIQLAQWAMAPTQLLLIIPFVRLGEWLLHAPRQAVSIEEGTALIRQGVGRAVVVLWDAIVHAGFAWIVVAPFATYAIYRLLIPIFRRTAAHLGAYRSAAVSPETETVEPRQ